MKIWNSLSNNQVIKALVIIISVLILVVLSCLLFIKYGKKGAIMNDSPLVTVIKLQSAESNMDFIEAEKYIDIERVYGELATRDKGAKDLWKEYLSFGRSLSKSKKFTNYFNYYHYEITVEVNGEDSFVIFKNESGSQVITYYLRKVNNNWKVVKIHIVK